MNDPKKLPFVYLISGIIAIGSALYFMTLEADNIFDWFILGMGVVAVIKGVREYWQQYGGLPSRAKPAPAAGTVKPAAGTTPGEDSKGDVVPETPPDDKA